MNQTVAYIVQPEERTAGVAKPALVPVGALRVHSVKIEQKEFSGGVRADKTSPAGDRELSDLTLTVGGANETVANFGPKTGQRIQYKNEYFSILNLSKVSNLTKIYLKKERK